MESKSILPPIPGDVPFCHKNYDVAKELIYSTKGVTTEAPFDMSKKSWKNLLDIFTNWNESNTENYSNDWKRTEEFFKHLISQAEEDVSSSSEEQALACLDIDVEDKNSENDSSPEAILDLSTELLERECSDLAEQTLRFLDNESSERLQIYKNVVDAAITSALTRRRGHSDEIPDYKKFNSVQAGIKDLARVNEKYIHSKELKTLGLYKAINGELTAIKPISEKPRELFIMIDDSSSMDSYQKKGLLYLTLLMARRRAKQGVTVKVFFFESELYDRECDLEKEMPQIGLSGYATNVQKALSQLAKKIQSKNASILVVNDGQDKVSSDFKPACRMCVLSLQQENEGLRKACKRSGGKFFNVV